MRNLSSLLNLYARHQQTKKPFSTKICCFIYFNNPFKHKYWFFFVCCLQRKKTSEKKRQIKKFCFLVFFKKKNCFPSKKNNRGKRVAMVDVLQNMSKQQSHVLDYVNQGYNVTVKANPGSGKTRLILQMASAFPEKNILILSFNTALVKETEDKLNQLAIERSGWKAVHTYHGLLGTITSETVFDELIFGELLRQVDFHAIDDWKYHDVELLIIDEAQDLKERFVLMILIVISILATKKSALQLVFLFDENQTLYFFYPINKADARYALLAPQIFGPYLEQKQWENVVLPMTYRLTPQNVTFLNTVMPTLDLVSGHAESKLHNYVTLYIADVYRDAAQIVLDIVHREAGIAHHYGKIAILVSSVRSPHSPARAVVDVLAANGIPVYVSRGMKSSSIADDNGPINDVRKNKVQIMTDHNSKGQEFDVTIKINDSYFFDGSTIVNPALVANTRARERSYIIQHMRNITQQQVDDLLSHPAITQRTLRVIVKREVPIELSKKRKRKQQQQQSETKDGNSCQPDVQHAIACENMFAFLDVEHMEQLMKHVIVEPLGAQEFDDTIVDDSSCEGDNEGDEQQQHRFVQQSDICDYIHTNVIAMNNNDNVAMFVDVLRIVNQAIELALEFFFSRRLTSRATQINDRTRFANGVQEREMHARLQDPMFRITNLYCDNHEEFFTKCQDALPQFAALAIVIDAYDNYRDLLYQLCDTSFAATEDVRLRFATLRCIIESLIHGHAQIMETNNTATTTTQELVWNTQQNGHFMRDGLPLELTCNVPLHSKDKSLFVFYSYDVEISNDDRLRALAATMTCKPSIANPSIFLVNLVSLTVEKLSLASDTTQQQLHSPPNATITMSGGGKNPTRHILCEFLETALQCKFWSFNDDGIDEQEDDEDEIAQSLKRKQHDDIDFIANIHAKMTHCFKKEKHVST